MHALDSLSFAFELVEMRTQECVKAHAIAVAAERLRDLRQRQTSASRTPHEARTLQIVLAILAIATRRARGFRQQAAFFVHAERGGADADAT